MPIDSIEALFVRTKGQILPGLDRVALAYEKLQRPLDGIPVILVGGTNGKGTTCAFLSLIFQRLGLNTAFYSSPHLKHYCERLWIDGHNPPSEDFVSTLTSLQSIISSELLDQLSFFEVFTLVSFMMIREAGAAVAILEVGMGGRWDATNITDPVISAVSGVALDHQQYLGHNISLIALEKVQIARPARPFFWGRGGLLADDPAAEQCALEHARRIGCDLRVRGEDFDSERALVWTRVEQDGKKKRADAKVSEMMVPYLVQNLSLAFAIAAEYCPHRFSEIAAIVESMRPGSIEWPAGQRGRFETLILTKNDQKQSLIIDACHNVDGAEALLAALETAYPSLEFGDLPGFVSILNDKNFNDIVDILKRRLKPIVFFGSKSPRSWKPTELAIRHQPQVFYPDFISAWQRVTKWSHRPFVICGSVSAAGEVLSYFDDFAKDANGSIVETGL